MFKRYRKIGNEEYQFHTFLSDNFNKEVWLEDTEDFEKLEDGSYAIYYNDDKTINQDKVQITRKDAQAYLDSTDWIWSKYKRDVEFLKTMTHDDFVTKYNDVIQKQKESAELL